MKTIFSHSKCTYIVVIALIATAITFTCCTGSNHRGPSFSSIEKGFLSIPDSIQTSIYWYWISDNISKEGVIKDLEAMKRAGINRAFIGNIGLNDLPSGKVKIFTDEWWDILHAALKKATELKIDIGIFNSPGWSQSGGPWIKPEQSMRYLNSSRMIVSGPRKLNVRLEAPCSDFQRVSVIAYRDGEYQKMSEMARKVKSNPAISNIKATVDGDTSTFILLHKNEKLRVDIKTPMVSSVRSLVIQTAQLPTKARVEFYAHGLDGYTLISEFDIDRSNPGLVVGFDPYAPVVISVPKTDSRKFRLIFTGGYPSGGIAEIELSAQPLVERYPEKSLAKMFQTPLPYWKEYMWPVQPEVDDKGLVIDPGKVHDLTKKMDDAGFLHWDVPEGEWIIMQTGMTTTGVINEPATPEGTGLEADKMSRKHIASHFDAFLGEILRRIPPEDRKSWKLVVEDSYERGGQNWTDGFAEEFRTTYGYDPVPYLPVLKGYVVGNRDMSDRFLWDLRRLVADKIATDYVGGLREISHEHGLTTWLENYGHWGFPAEFLQYGGQSDEVGGEFWSEGDLGNIENRAASSCAHIYGKRKVSAESFTCGGAPFSRYPAKMKRRGDRFFTEGINNTLLHVYIHQPDENMPGVNAWFGNEFNRHNTWFSQMDVFTGYLKRVNFMLQQGNYVADVAYFIGEDTPKMTGICEPPLPPGYSFDYINSEVIMKRLTVRDGKLILPDGMSYRMLVLPELTTMRPELLKKISELVILGAVVMGPPPQRSPSLRNYPDCDQEVRNLAAALWGPVDGINVKSTKVGLGTIMVGLTMQEALSQIGISPDFTISQSDPVLFIHRNRPDGDIYFISNQSDSAITINPEFRTTGKTPELWDAVSGKIRDLPQFSSDGEKTMVPLKLDASGSAFIVFRKKNHNGGNHGSAMNFPGRTVVLEVKGPWTIRFDTVMGGPSGTVSFPVLSDWTTSSNDSIKYYSGTAVYEARFNLEQSFAGKKLDLGIGPVNGMARIKINGKPAGGLWTAPWEADISSLAVAGENTIEVEIANTWVNRLIGDSHLSPEKRETSCFVNPYKPDSPLIPSGLTGPVKIFYTEN